MPPDEALHASKIGPFETWIRQGAVFPEGSNLISIATAPWWEEHQPDSLPALDRPPHEVIDTYIFQSLKDQGIHPAPKATDATLVKRLTFDLAGRPPTPSERDRFVYDPAPDRVGSYVDYLIASPCFEQHQVREFNWLLMDGKGGVVTDYLKRAIREDRSWDRIFKELILADHQDDNARGATGFIKDRIRDIDRLTNDVSVKFFGVNISCAQCHDHPNVRDWTQDRYYGMKSFFNRTFEHGGFVAEKAYGKVRYKNTAGDTLQAPLQFIDGAALPDASPEWSDEKRRIEKEQLERFKQEKKPVPIPANSRRALLVREGLDPDQQGYFARAIVNRVWHRLMGVGLVEPLDQMHGANPPSHPALLQWLSHWLTASDYDLNALIRGIVMSQAYQRSSAWESGERPPKNTYAAANLRALTPSQYASALLLGTSAPSSWRACEPGEPAHQERLNTVLKEADQAARWFERPGDPFYFSVNEALQLSNSEEVASILYAPLHPGLLTDLMQEKDWQERVRKAYLSILHRLPSNEEVQALEPFFAAEIPQKLEPRLRSATWALLTCTEIRLNH